MMRNKCWSLALAIVVLPLFTAAATAQTRFINLSDRNVSIARYSYQPYSSNSGGLQVVTEEGWNFSGWWNVAPGGTYEGDPGHYFVQGINGPITWNNCQKSPGFITSAKFSVFLPKSGWAEKEKELLRTGYKKVDFQEFGKGNFRISGDAYVMREKTVDFDFSSRSIQFHNRDFAVPGKVAYISYSGEEWGAKGISWGYGNQKAWVTLSTEGAQKRLGGPREPGYYRGKVTVHYTEKK